MSVHSCPSNPCPICRPETASKERFAEPTRPDVPGLPAHLSDDAPHWQCSGCGRKSWAPRDAGRLCGMPQPDGQTCAGRLSAPPIQRGEEMGTRQAEGVSAAPAGRFTPTEPKSQWCRNCGLFIARHREQIGHAALCPVAVQPDPDAAVRARLPHDFDADRFSVCWCGQYSYHPIHGKTAREAFAAGRAVGRDEGTRGEREACEKLARDRAKKHNLDAHDRRKVSLPRFGYAQDEANAIAHAIASRGKGGA